MMGGRIYEAYSVRRGGLGCALDGYVTNYEERTTEGCKSVLLGKLDRNI